MEPDDPASGSQFKQRNEFRGAHDHSIMIIAVGVFDVKNCIKKAVISAAAAIANTLILPRICRVAHSHPSSTLCVGYGVVVKVTIPLVTWA